MSSPSISSCSVPTAVPDETIATIVDGDPRQPSEALAESFAAMSRFVPGDMAPEVPGLAYHPGALAAYYGTWASASRRPKADTNGSGPPGSIRAGDPSLPEVPVMPEAMPEPMTEQRPTVLAGCRASSSPRSPWPCRSAQSSGRQTCCVVRGYPALPRTVRCGDAGDRPVAGLPPRSGTGGGRERRGPVPWYDLVLAMRWPSPSASSSQ